MKKSELPLEEKIKSMRTYFLMIKQIYFIEQDEDVSAIEQIEKEFNLHFPNDQMNEDHKCIEPLIPGIVHKCKFEKDKKSDVYNYDNIRSSIDAMKKELDFSECSDESIEVCIYKAGMVVNDEQYVENLNKKNMQYERVFNAYSEANKQIEFQNESWKQAKDLIKRKNKSIEDLIEIKENLEKIAEEMNMALHEIYKLADSNPTAVQDIAFDNWRINKDDKK